MFNIFLQNRGYRDKGQMIMCWENHKHLWKAMHYVKKPFSCQFLVCHILCSDKKWHEMAVRDCKMQWFGVIFQWIHLLSCSKDDCITGNKWGFLGSFGTLFSNFLFAFFFSSEENLQFIWHLYSFIWVWENEIVFHTALPSVWKCLKFTVHTFKICAVWKSLQI